MHRGIAVGLLSLVTACGGGVADLKPAPEPGSFEGGPWAVEFSLHLEPGFWTAGAHRYQIWLECEPLGPRQWSQHNFEADVTTDLYDEDIYVRLYGLSEHKTGPIEIKHINVAQPTVAIVTVLGLAEEQAAEAADECVGELRLEDGTVIELPPGDPFRV